MPSNNKNPEEIDLVGLIEQPVWKSILLDLVRKEKMDVWRIDLLDLSEKYLKKIQELKENNLRIPANAVLACAILLKLKSRAIQLPSEEEEEEPLEMPELPELMPLSRIKERKVTLDELLSEIESVIDKTRKKSSIPRETEKIVMEMPSIEKQNLSAKIDSVYEKILENADKEGLVLFSGLSAQNNALETINTFICLLFLSEKGRIFLWQESFFGEIVIALPKKEVGNAV